MSIERKIADFNNKYKYWRAALVPILAAAGLAGVEAHKYANQSVDKAGIVEASPNFCSTTYKTVGEIKAGEPYANLRVWNGTGFDFMSDAVAIRYDSQHQKLSSDRFGYWIDRTTADVSQPLEVQTQIDPANLSQIKAGKDAAMYALKGVWKADGKAEIFDITTGTKVGEVKPDDMGTLYIVFPENNSRFRVNIVNPHPNSIEANLSNINNSEVANAQAIGNIFDLRGKVQAVVSEPCPTTTNTPTVTSTPNATFTVTPTRVPETATSTPTPQFVEGRKIEPLAFAAPNKSINETKPGEFINPRIFVGQDLYLNNALDGLVFFGANNAKQSDTQGKYFLNVPGNTDTLAIMRFNNANMKDIFLGRKNAGLFINAPGFKNKQVDVFDYANPKPVHLGTVLTDESGQANIMAFNKVGRTKQVIGVRVRGIDVATAVSISIGEIPDGNAEEYSSGKFPNKLDVTSRLTTIAYNQTFAEIVLVGRQQASEGTPVPPTPTVPPAPVVPGPCSEAPLSVDPQIVDPLPIKFWHEFDPHALTVPRLSIDPDSSWPFRYRIAQPDRRLSNRINYSSSGVGHVRISAEPGVCGVSIGFATDPRYLREFLGAGDIVSQHVTVTNERGEQVKAFAQYIVTEGPGKGGLGRPERHLDGFLTTYLPDDRVIEMSQIFSPYNRNQRYNVDIIFGSTSAQDAADRSKDHLREDLRFSYDFNR